MPTPPTQPPPPPTTPQPIPPREGPSDAARAYKLMSDKVGGVPNVRLKDNVIQFIAIAAATVLGAIAGWIFPWSGSWLAGTMEIAVGALIGMVAGLFLSGIVLMVVGWFRK